MGLKVLAVSSQEKLEHRARPNSLPPPGAVAGSSWNPSGILGKNAWGLVCTASPDKPTLLSCLQHWASSRNIPASNKRQGSLIVCWLCDFPNKKNIEDRILHKHTPDATTPRQQSTSRIKPLKLWETRCDLAQQWRWSATTAWPGPQGEEAPCLLCVAL